MLWETAKNKNLIAHNDSLITLISNGSCEKNPTKITNIYWVELFSCTGWKKSTRFEPASQRKWVK